MIVVRIVIHESPKIAKGPSETTAAVDELSSDLGSEAAGDNDRDHRSGTYMIFTTSVSHCIVG